MQLTSALVILLTSALTSGREIYDCYVTDNNPYLMFASKTAYDLIYERPRSRTEEVKKCEPIQLWLMARHGTRSPSKSIIRAMQQLENLRSLILSNHEEKKNGRLCYGDIDKFRMWQINVSISDAKLLTTQGKADLYFIGKRYRAKFPTLFEQGYSQNMFVFRHTDTERTRQSASSFAEGMFGPGANVWLPTPLQNDTVIDPAANCTAWKTHVKNNTELFKEYELFRTGSEMTHLIHNVSQRLGFQYDLASDTVMLMYDACRYEKAWHLRDRSTWCAAFSREELIVLEYLKDLKTFYESGYGHEMNLKLGCTPIKDMLERFLELEHDKPKSENQPRGVFYFTHSSTILNTLSRLGIASHGLPMRHDNFLEQKNRGWRSSKLTPFASNIAAVFFKCTDGEANRVMFYLNEKAVNFQGCILGLCPWVVIKERYKDIPYHCDLGWCSSASTLVKSITTTIGLFIVMRIL